MILPTITKNGTPPQELLSGTHAAFEAARNLERALQGMTVHGRDYPLEYEPALQHYAGLLSQARSVTRDLAQLVVHLQTSLQE